jgi:hypothetical protein
MLSRARSSLDPAVLLTEGLSRTGEAVEATNQTVGGIESSILAFRDALIAAKALATNVDRMFEWLELGFAGLAHEITSLKPSEHPTNVLRGHSAD